MTSFLACPGNVCNARASKSSTNHQTGAALFAAMSSVEAVPRCGCSGRAMVSPIVVNRVQSAFLTPRVGGSGRRHR